MTDGYDFDPFSDRETIDELHRVLEPLLTNPWRYGGPWGVCSPSEDKVGSCVFCDAYRDPNDHYDERLKKWMPAPEKHEPGCPVLRKDELLNG